jgi:hypothetical protein
MSMPEMNQDGANNLVLYMRLLYLTKSSEGVHIE